MIFLLVNLTSAVYISSSGRTLTFGAKSEDSLCARPLQPADGDGVQGIAALKGVRSPLDGLRSSPVKVSYKGLHKTPG